MQGISDINIIGIDATRPPYIRKQPYIDIYFELSHQAPKDWCNDLNSLFSLNPITNNTKITTSEGLFIETWVRDPEEITTLLEHIKTTISECTRQYIERIQLAAQQSGDRNTTVIDESSPQAILNKIVASLDFSQAD